MAILVTGATGFVGLRLCEQLRRAGKPVRAVLRPSIGGHPKVGELTSLGVDTIMLDLKDANAVRTAMADVQTVYHLAWSSNRLSRREQGTSGSSPVAENLRAMETLISCTRNSSVRRFVFTSTVSVYGPADEWGPLPRKEADARADLERHQNPYFRFYASAKYLAEQMLQSSCPPPDRVILRPAMVYGPAAQFAEQFVENAMTGSGAGPRPHPIQWVHVDDVVRALVLAETARDAAQMILNIAGDTALLNHTVAAEVQRLASPDGKIAGGQALDWNPRVPQYDTSAAERCLGFRPKIGWRRGLSEMVAAERTGAA